MENNKNEEWNYDVYDQNYDARIKIHYIFFSQVNYHF